MAHRDDLPEWDPDIYAGMIRDEIHHYDELQDHVAQATMNHTARSILDLGIGAGETAGRVMAFHPTARLVGIDSSRQMLRGARERLSNYRLTLLEQDLAAPLPDEQFDLVISALAIHHIAGHEKAKLFQRVVNVLVPGGRFVMGDVVIPEHPSDALIKNQPGYDFPSKIDDQLRWMMDAGMAAEVVWACKDLAVLRADRPLS